MRSWLAGCVAVSLLTVAAAATTVQAQVGTIRGKVVDSTGAPRASRRRRSRRRAARRTE